MKWWGNSALLVSGYDSDAQAYITAVEAADGQALEVAVRDAINGFVVGCKADGIWAAIKACCILAGARTLAGALVPLVGPAPTSFNFTGASYNRKTGLLADAATTYLSSNRSNDADPQDSNHNAVWVSSAPTTGISLMGTGANNAGANNILTVSTRSRSATAQTYATSLTSGFAGHARASATTYTNRANGISTTHTQASESPLAGNLYLFARNTGGASTTPILFSNARLSFYSIGESLDLTLLDARITGLMNTLAGLTL